MVKNNVVVRDSDSKTIRLDKQEAEQSEIDARAKRVVNVDGSGGVVSPSNPLPVLITDGTDIADVIPTNGYKGIVAIAPGHVSLINSTSETLLGDASFDGEWEEITNFGVLVITVNTSHVSATDGLCVEFSSDGVNIDSSDTFSIPANTGKTFSFQAANKYFKVVYTNGDTTQTHMRLQTVLKPYYVKPSSHRISDTISPEDDAELVTNVNKGLSELDGNFENVNTFRNALNVTEAFVHKVGISEHVRRNLDGSTTLDVAASSGDTLINTADTNNFVVGSLITINGTAEHERSHFHVTAISVGVSMTLDRPLDKDHVIGSVVQEIGIAMNFLGTLANPLSFKVQPTSDERWQITRIMITMLDQSTMDDAKFGGLNALPNGVVIRLVRNGVVQTLTHWKSNGDLKDDMYDVEYSSKAPSGFYGLNGRWTFTKAEFVADLDGATGDYLEVLIQDNLVALDDFEVKAQGRLFGG